MIRLVLYDIAGVLYKERRLIPDVLTPLLKGEVSNEELLHRYQDRKKGEMTEEKFWEGVTDWKRKQEEFIKNLHAQDLTQVMNVQAEKKAILSNHFKVWADAIIKRDHLERYFDQIFISEEIGFAKPDKAAYEFVLRTMHVKAEETLFVDDQERNLIPAGELGIKTVWFRHDEKSTNFKPNFTITSLDEVAKIVETLNNR